MIPTAFSVGIFLCKGGFINACTRITLEQHQEGFQKKLQIQSEGIVLDVHQIEHELFTG